ncbi:hypothetical protein A2765_02400 [Candidatus Kaiserbacteria bacterium RIFCSPHIGHO2_01_FULL_56_24]|uniref:Ig-like domain-containing protein n=1 Tax=Candidatus Kaiserbacteria bacterium RIFCSPHIGHO2_01_FULL_56_24 TaxID=1798487 RepID=A0A1F6DAW6_9BACT|nr:MAG: hypothetical protein A2765_02400 [Candidatus Kaiserbacteria bacterium RIFCSPHIGHO2_01_FULL_56_24]
MIKTSLISFIGVLLFPFLSYAAGTTFTAAGADQTYVAPATQSLWVQLWGAGGGGGGNGPAGNCVGGGGSGGVGGAGSYTQGYITITPNQTLRVIVGAGGVGAGSSYTYGGGAPTQANGSCGGQAWGGSGGGRSAVANSTTDLITAGGGGGGGEAGHSNCCGNNGGNGGAGGATNASTQTGSYNGAWGTQYQGGYGGTDGYGSGGGGGGGYYGGGGGGGGLCGATWCYGGGSGVATGGPGAWGGGGGGGMSYCPGRGCTISAGAGGSGGGGGGGTGVSGTVVITPAPTNPVVSGPARLNVGSNGTYTFQSSDPQGGTIAYTIDWDNNGVVDERVPASGYVGSGAQQSATHQWSSAGTYTYGIAAVTQAGLFSETTSGSVVVTVFPSCSVTLSPSSINTGQSSTLSYSSSGASWMSIANVGYVTPDQSGSFPVQPNATTDYSCTAGNPQGDTSTQPAILTVNQPPACSISVDPSSVPSGTDATLTWSSSNASSLTISPLGSVALNGSQQVSPAQTTTYSGTATGAGGSAACTAPANATNTLSISCTPSYTCSGDTIQYTDSSCQTSSVTTCSSPGYCSAGSSSCLTSTMNVNGHLSVSSSLVRKGGRVTLTWSVTDAQSCSVSGSNGDSFPGSSSPSGGQLSGILPYSTTFHLHCVGLTDSLVPTIDEYVAVYTAPTWREL